MQNVHVLCIAAKSPSGLVFSEKDSNAKKAIKEVRYSDAFYYIKIKIKKWYHIGIAPRSVQYRLHQPPDLAPPAF